MTVPVPAPERILSVLELTRMVKRSLEERFNQLWVKGELSGVKPHANGHLYFNLKEGRDAVLPCVLFRTNYRQLGFPPREGVEVEAFGELSVYEPRGAYQFVVRQMRPAGVGALLLELERLKQVLAAEGLFDSARKRPLPRYPRRVGLVTSPVGAAVRDLVTVMRARWPAIQIVLAPVRVQGEGAGVEIAAAIHRFAAYGKVDVLVVGRGGGSIEDLWAFNEELVVRAIAASPIPVVSAVGHEVDWTLADLAADLRAATPSHAAECVVPKRDDVAAQVARLADHARRAMRRAIADRRRAAEAAVATYGFRRIHDLFGRWQQIVDEAVERIRGALRGRVRDARHRLERHTRSWTLREWPRVLAERAREVADERAALDGAVARALAERRRRVGALEDRLRALSPRLVLERGYCLARAADGTVLRSAAPLAPGDRLTLEFARGEADARVEAVRPAPAE